MSERFRQTFVSIMKHMHKKHDDNELINSNKNTFPLIPSTYDVVNTCSTQLTKTRLSPCKPTEGEREKDLFI
jgi:hypothetical protein